MVDMQKNHGTGPGAITPDGCAVDFYAILPAAGEPDIIAAALPPGATILELGAGVGRVTHPLLDLGFTVIAVDESPEMLAKIDGARTVLSSIQALDLGERFDCVLMMSYLINTDDPADAAALLDACRRHMKQDGHVLIQRHTVSWFDNAAETESTRAGITSRLRDISRPADGFVSATVVYEAGESTWTQSFTARRIDDTELHRMLTAAGLRVERFLTEDGSWLSAVPA